MKHLVSIGTIGAAALLLVACGGGAPAISTVPTAAAPTPSSASTRSAAPSSIATTSPSLAASASPSAVPATSTPALPTSSAVAVQSLPAIFFNHSDPALEALLPATVSAVPMQKYSLTLTQILDAGGDRPGIDAFLQAINKTEADGSFAAAFDPTESIAGGIDAFKVTGADAATLLAGITSVEQSDFGAGATTTQATVGGKPVTVVSIGSDVNDTEWIYGNGDVVYVVHAADDTDAASFLATLP